MKNLDAGKIYSTEHGVAVAVEVNKVNGKEVVTLMGSSARKYLGNISNVTEAVFQVDYDKKTELRLYKILKDYTDLMEIENKINELTLKRKECMLKLESYL